MKGTNEGKKRSSMVQDKNRHSEKGSSQLVQNKNTTKFERIAPMLFTNSEEAVRQLPNSGDAKVSTDEWVECNCPYIDQLDRGHAG